MQGRGIYNEGNLTLTTTLLHNNKPDDLGNTYGSAYYVLPAPPGRYIEGVVNCTQLMCGKYPGPYYPCALQSCLPANFGNMTAILPQYRPLTEAELLPNCSAGFYANRTLSPSPKVPSAHGVAAAAPSSQYEPSGQGPWQSELLRPAASPSVPAGHLAGTEVLPSQ